MKHPGFRVGETAETKHVWGGYILPEGVPEGAQVKILAFDREWYEVDFQGTTYRIYMACLRKPDTSGEV